MEPDGPVDQEEKVKVDKVTETVKPEVDLRC